MPLFIASERLSNTDLAIDGCDRDHQLELPADSLARAFRGLTSHKGRIIVSACLRDPIPHLVSRYIRCQTNRRFAGQPTQDIGSYLEIQVSGYHRAEFDSALFPIVHKKFIGYHRSFAEVHAYGFAEINRSEDAFRTMGIGGQEIISYKELPRENAASMTKEDRTNLECQVRAKLAKLDFIREIEGNQLFE
ncbi:hypothetical protein [Vulcanococcus limneticus]|uniref:hypothetical protein n=1 Tax=Vulcanococcus limneticus TaxID=2170428 RepID=UPI00398BD4AE